MVFAGRDFAIEFREQRKTFGRCPYFLEEHKQEKSCLVDDSLSKCVFEDSEKGAAAMCSANVHFENLRAAEMFEQEDRAMLERRVYVLYGCLVKP
jgi:hypothetical protein